MNYCVKKDTTTVIDGSDNSEEVMIENARNQGFTEDAIEIITEEEYQARLAENTINKVSEPTIEERIASMESALSTLMGV